MKPARGQLNIDWSCQLKSRMCSTIPSGRICTYFVLHATAPKPQQQRSADMEVPVIFQVINKLLKFKLNGSSLYVIGILLKKNWFYAYI